MTNLDQIVLSISCALSDLETNLSHLIEYIMSKENEKVDAQIIFEGKIDVDKIKKIKKMLTDDVGDVIVDEKYDENTKPYGKCDEDKTKK